MSENVGNVREGIDIGPNGGWRPRALGALDANQRVRRLEKRINTDPLTGLNGEYPLQDMVNGLETRWNSDYKKGEYLNGTFVIMDANGLHDVNHKYGKLSGGNDYLKAVARSLEKASRNTGRAFRASKASDEFVLYLPGFKIRTEIDDVLDNVDADLTKNQDEFQQRYPGIKLGLSYAVATFHRAYSPKAAFADANNKMGEAKESKTGKRVGNVGRIFINELKPEDSKYE